MFVVTETSVRYLLPARLDDLLDVTVHVEHAGRAQMRIRQQAWRHDGPESRTLLTEGTIRIGCIAAGTFKPQRIPTAVASAVRPEAFTE